MRAATRPRLWVGTLLAFVAMTAMAENAVTTDPVSLRAGPDSAYPEVAQLDADTPLQVMGCLDDWSWCDVSVEDTRGWVYSPDISFEYQGGYVPFYSYAPGFGVPVVSFSIDAYWGSHYHDRPWFARRDEWIHRTIHHQRPSGPPPSSAPPPREVVRAERPHGDRALRLGSAEPAHRAAEHNVTPRPQEHAAPPPPVPARRDGRAMERSAPQHEPKPAERAAPQHEEGHMRPAEHPSAAAHEEDRHAPPEKSPAPPHRPDDNDHR